MQTQQFIAIYPDNPAYLENQWAEDTLVAFEREHGEEGGVPTEPGLYTLSFRPLV